MTVEQMVTKVHAAIHLKLVSGIGVSNGPTITGWQPKSWWECNFMCCGGNIEGRGGYYHHKTKKHIHTMVMEWLEGYDGSSESRGEFIKECFVKFDKWVVKNIDVETILQPKLPYTECPRRKK